MSLLIFICISDISRLPIDETEVYNCLIGITIVTFPQCVFLVETGFSKTILSLTDDQYEMMETLARQGSLRETHLNKFEGDQRLRSYKKLFCNGNELEKRVFLVGEAGAGKQLFVNILQICGGRQTIEMKNASLHFCHNKKMSLC